MTHMTQERERRASCARQKKSGKKLVLSPGSRPHSLSLTAQSERKVKLKAECLTAARAMRSESPAPCDVTPDCTLCDEVTLT